MSKKDINCVVTNTSSVKNTDNVNRALLVTPETRIRFGIWTKKARKLERYKMMEGVLSENLSNLKKPIEENPALSLNVFYMDAVKKAEDKLEFVVETIQKIEFENSKAIKLRSIAYNKLEAVGNYIKGMFKNKNKTDMKSIREQVEIAIERVNADENEKSESSSTSTGQGSQDIENGNSILGSSAGVVVPLPAYNSESDDTNDFDTLFNLYTEGNQGVLNEYADNDEDILNMSIDDIPFDEEDKKKLKELQEDAKATIENEEEAKTENLNSQQNVSIGTEEHNELTKECYYILRDKLESIRSNSAEKIKQYKQSTAENIEIARNLDEKNRALKEKINNIKTM